MATQSDTRTVLEHRLLAGREWAVRDEAPGTWTPLPRRRQVSRPLYHSRIPNGRDLLQTRAPGPQRIHRSKPMQCGPLHEPATLPHAVRVTGHLPGRKRTLLCAHSLRVSTEHCHFPGPCPIAHAPRDRLQNLAKFSFITRATIPQVLPRIKGEETGRLFSWRLECFYGHKKHGPLPHEAVSELLLDVP